MAKGYLDAIRAIVPNGPYQLAGHSFGGVVAYEMAQQLKRNNEHVDRLILLETPSPTYIQEQMTKGESAAWRGVWLQEIEQAISQ